MEDSPLSVIANIAGILTFAVAILASIYVRFMSLRNGRVEMETIRKSVDDVVNDLGKMNSSSSAVLQGNTHLIINQDDEDDVIWLKRLGTSLLATEVYILAYCLRAMNAETSMVEAALSSARSLRDIGITPTTFTDFVLKSQKATQKATQKAAQTESDHLKRFLYLIPDLFTEQLPMSWALYILTVGSTPTLMRWYRVREKVLEKVREREILRSRILSHQVSMANSSARRSKKALERLEQQHAEFKIKLEELTRLVTTACHAPARPASDDTSGIPEETHTQVSTGQQEDVERHVGAEGSEFETTDCCA